LPSQAHRTIARAGALAVALALALAAGAVRADAPATPPPAVPVVEPAPEPAPVVTGESPLCVRLTPDLSLHLNLSMGGYGYDLARGQGVGLVAFSGLYALDWRRLIAVGGGISFETISIGSAAAVLVAGPALQWGSIRLRPAVIASYRFAGPVDGWLIAAAPTLEL